MVWFVQRWVYATLMLVAMHWKWFECQSIHQYSPCCTFNPPYSRKAECYFGFLFVLLLWPRGFDLCIENPFLVCFVPFYKCSCSCSDLYYFHWYQIISSIPISHLKNLQSYPQWAIDYFCKEICACLWMRNRVAFVLKRIQCRSESEVKTPLRRINEI